MERTGNIYIGETIDMAKLGGSIFTHNCIKYDYCFKESIRSLCGVCDEVVCLDAESDDGTLEELKVLRGELPNLKIIQDKWEQHIEGSPGYDRLCILANKAREELSTEWHFMLQADEVIHESSHDHIREFIDSPNISSVVCLRYNIYGDFDHYVKLTSAKKPCGDFIVRLARKSCRVVGDAESIMMHPVVYRDEPQSAIKIFHYGMVRHPYIFVDKVIDMQKWFFGVPDYRFVQYKSDGNRWNPLDIIPKEELNALKINHPSIVSNWIEKRRSFYNINMV